jgi:hypothetical protein
MGHDVCDRHGDRAAQPVDEVCAEPSRYPGRKGGDDYLVEVFDVHRIEDRLIWIRVADPGLDHVHPGLLEPTASGVCLLTSYGPGLALGPTGQMLDGGGGNKENYFGMVALRRRSDRSEELIGFSRLMRHSEQTCHHTPRSDHVTVALYRPTVKTSHA